MASEPSAFRHPPPARRERAEPSDESPRLPELRWVKVALGLLDEMNSFGAVCTKLGDGPVGAVGPERSLNLEPRPGIYL